MPRCSLRPPFYPRPGETSRNANNWRKNAELSCEVDAPVAAGRVHANKRLAYQRLISAISRRGGRGCNLVRR